MSICAEKTYERVVISASNVQARATSVGILLQPRGNNYRPLRPSQHLTRKRTHQDGKNTYHDCELEGLSLYVLQIQQNGFTGRWKARRSSERGAGTVQSFISRILSCRDSKVLVIKTTGCKVSHSPQLCGHRHRTGCSLCNCEASSWQCVSTKTVIALEQAGCKLSAQGLEARPWAVGQKWDQCTASHNLFTAQFGKSPLY